ncbi:hypothetical protein BDZ45DRAFT_802634 [Acephala macrosclerotiorum]|nr:hypothetical protein BDZ45DRAFT_802634 [Acephala macrosclerotiorum]
MASIKRPNVAQRGKDEEGDYDEVEDAQHQKNDSRIIFTKFSQAEHHHRKDEHHQIQLRNLETKASHLSRHQEPSPPAVIIKNQYGDFYLSPATETLFSTQLPHILRTSKGHLITIACNTFEPGGLPELEEDSPIEDDCESLKPVYIAEDLRKPLIAFTKNMKKDNETPRFGDTSEIWSRNMLTYVSVWSLFRTRTHAMFVSRLLMFFNKIIELAETYKRKDIILPLALLHHRNCLKDGFVNLDI